MGGVRGSFLEDPLKQSCSCKAKVSLLNPGQMLIMYNFEGAEGHLALPYSAVSFRHV